MYRTDLEIYHRNKTKWQAENPNGGFVVINGSDVLGIWHSRLDALRYGIDRYGNVPFLVKDIMDTEAAINFTRHLSFL